MPSLLSFLGKRLSLREEVRAAHGAEGAPGSVKARAAWGTGHGSRQGVEAEAAADGGLRLLNQFRVVAVSRNDSLHLLASYNFEARYLKV